MFRIGEKYFLYIYAGAFLTCLIIGFQVSKTSQWDGKVAYMPDGPRTPAATYKVFDFSHLKGTSLKEMLQKRVLSEAIFLSDSEKVGLQLGHFISRSSLGNREMGCKLYSRVQLVLRSSAMANSGNPITMKIEGPCQTSIDDINTIAPLWIPMKKLKSKIEVQGYEKPLVINALTIVIENAGRQFPVSWTLYSAKLFSRGKGGGQLKINSIDIHKILNKQLSFTWTPSVPEEL